MITQEVRDHWLQEANIIINSWGESKFTSAVEDPYNYDDSSQVGRRRKIRRDDRDVQTMRSNKELDEDETYIPIRVVDMRIRQEVSSLVSAIQQPDRLLYLKDPEDPMRSLEAIERFFTELMRYPGWLIPWMRLLDAVLLHGGAALEIVADPSAPGMCRLEYIRREDLIFPLDCSDLQAVPHLIRHYRFTRKYLEEIRDDESYGFNRDAVNSLINTVSQREPHKKISVFRIYTKYKDIVYVWWYSPQVQTLLSDPQPLYLGILPLSTLESILIEMDSGIMSNVEIAPKPVDFYPVIWFAAEVTEHDILLASRGHAYRATPDQEALTRLWTSIVNAANRASKIYATGVDPNNPLGFDSELRQIKPNTINPAIQSFYSPPFPDSAIIAVAQQLMSTSQAVHSRVDFAAMNRRDSRKTATEIQAAVQQQQILQSTLSTLFSIGALNVYMICWKIVRTQVVLGNIKCPYPKQEFVIDYRFSSPIEHEAVIRAQRISLIKEILPLVAGTRMSEILLSYLIESYFPERAQEFRQVLEANNPAQVLQVAAQTIDLLRGQVPNLTEEQNNQLQQVIALLTHYATIYGGRNPTLGQPSGNPDVAEQISAS